MATRVVTAAVLLTAFLAAIFAFDSAQFAVLIAILVAIAAFEWGRSCRLGRAWGGAYASLVALTLAALVWKLPAPGKTALFLAATVFWLGLAPAWLARGVRANRQGLLLAAGAIVLLPAGLAAAALHPHWLLAVLGLIWTADSAAYFCGKAFGRHILAPSISPAKTWEGVAGALLATLAYAMICTALVPQVGARVPGGAWLGVLAGAEFLCGVSIVGDLFESALKRQAALKDSGALLPGHGGILDRIDSATSTLPVAALLLQWTIET